jgi:hypothetical protein
MNAPRAIFVVLIAATFGAFFVAQRLKNSPSVIQKVTYNGVFSPNRDGRKDRLRINFRLKESDDVTVSVLDDDGDRVRELLDDRSVPAYTTLTPSLSWDGRDDEGRMLPDGRYRIRLTLRRQGRSVVLPRSVIKDTTPPRPRVLSMGPSRAKGPELLPRPGGGSATAHFRAPGTTAPPAVLLFKTAPGRPRLVIRDQLEQGATSWSWNGTKGGRRVSAGTYLVAIQARDKAGNIGTSPPLDGSGLPARSHGAGFPGRGGITVRYLAAQPPAEAVKARDPVTVCIDARRKRYRWAIRRVGTPRPVKRGSGTRPCVTTKAPGGRSGAYLFEVRTRRHATKAAFAVQARRSAAGTARKPRGVLVVLPAITWQGRNPVDDDGDGAANLLDDGLDAKLLRPYSGDGLPAGFGTREAPVLSWLDRTGRTYDLTTDAALAARRGPRLEGHRGVLIPGDARWLPGPVRTRLRAFARGGGTVVSLGVDSLLRSVRLSDGLLAAPSPRRATDVFGARLRPVVRQATDLTDFQDDIQLFAGTTGLFRDVVAWEETAASGQEADLVARAVTLKPEGRNVVVAVRYGRGLVIRPGFPSFSIRLTPDPAISELMARMWTLLSR